MQRVLLLLRSHPGYFFLGCMAAGACVSRLPFLYESNGNLAFAPYLATWVLTGFLAGLLVPDRPWRWGAAMVLSLPILGVVLAPNPSDALLMQIVTVPLLPLMAVPIVVGAYCGRLAARPQDRSAKPTAPGPPVSVQAMLFFSLYIVCALSAFLSGNGSRLFVVWAIAAAIASALFATRFQVRPFRSTALAYAAVVAAYMTSVIYDSLNGGPSHHLLPVELWEITIMVGVVAGASAWLASRVRRRVQ